MPDVWTHKYVATRKRRTPDDGWRIEEKVKVTAGLHFIEGNSSPYFSVTGETWDRADGSTYWREGSCGQVTAEIKALWPELRPALDLHLSDDNGEPMHSLANARYWLGRTKYQDYDRDTLMRHLRITAEEADLLHSQTDDELAVWIDEVGRPRWKS
jgi:hypothetical protein